MTETSLDAEIMQPLSTTSTHLVAVRLKSPNKNIFRALMSLASAALLIRVMGLVYQIVVTSHFGLGNAMDAYFVASLVPSLVAQLIAGTVEYSVVPIYVQVRSEEGRNKASELFSTLLNILLIGTILLMVVMFIFRYQVVHLSAPALGSTSTALATSLMPFVIPILLLQALIALLESILNAEGQFGWPAYAGMLVPLTTAVFVLVASSHLGIVALCAGSLVGLCLQLVVFFIRLRRAKLSYRPIINIHQPAIASLLALASPALLGALIIQISPLVDQIFASTLSPGSISALNYALKLNSVPVGIIFVSVGRAVLPYLSYQASSKNMEAFKETLRVYLWATAIVTLVISAFMTVLAHPIVQILFQRGAFTAQDTNLTASTLIGFTIGLTPMSFGFILSKAFNALAKTRVMLAVTIFSVTSNAIFDYFFARIWQSTGIALATSAVYFCTMFILLFTLRRTIGRLNLLVPPGEIFTVIWKTSIEDYYTQLTTWRQERFPSFRLSYHTRVQLLRIGVVLAVFAVGAYGIYYNYLYAVLAAVGAVVIVIFLRYPYVLLLAWALINAFIGSNISFFNGNHFLTALTIPTLLLMFSMPLKETFKRMPVLAFLCLYLAWVFASIGISAIGISAFMTLWLNFLDFAALCVLTINIITTRRRMLGLIDAILAPSAFIALYGIYGYLTKHNGVLDSTGVFRAYSIFNAAPSLALLLSIVVPFAIYRTYTLHGIKRLGGLLLTVILVVGVGVTFSRGAFISLPLSIIILAFFFPSRKLKITMLSGIATIAVFLLLLQTVGNVPLFDRFFAQNVATFNGRTYIWSALLQNFDPTHLLGNGLLASDTLLASLSVGSIATAPSNLFIGTLYDHGIIGVILLSLIFIALFIGQISGIRKTRGEHRLLIAAALSAAVSMIIQSQESNDFWIQAIAVYFWIFMALPFALYWSKTQVITPTPYAEKGREGKETLEEVEEVYGVERIDGAGIAEEAEVEAAVIIGAEKVNAADVAERVDRENIETKEVERMEAEKAEDEEKTSVENVEVEETRNVEEEEADKVELKDIEEENAEDEEETDEDATLPKMPAMRVKKHEPGLTDQ